MSTLRVLFADSPAPDREHSWALFGDDGALRRVGFGRPDGWPEADRREAVIAASRCRIAVLALPPLPEGRLQAAAAFAIEDQLAGPAEAQHVVASAQDRDGRLRVFVVDSALLDSIAGNSSTRGERRRFARVIAESDLFPRDSAWHWCIDAARPSRAFVGAPDGSAFPTEGVADDHALPPELVLLLARSQSKQPAVCVHGPVTAAEISHWVDASGAALTVVVPWRWHDAPAERFAAAVDLSPRATGQSPAPSAPARWPLFRPAMFVAAAALALHVAATVAEWAWLTVDAMRSTAAMRVTAARAGITTTGADGVQELHAGLLRRQAELRHASGMSAPGDPLPLLARAAPALARLPAGALKSAHYAGGAWTVELGPTDAAALRQLDQGLKASGLPAFLATTSAGTRARFGTP